MLCAKPCELFHPHQAIHGWKTSIATADPPIATNIGPEVTEVIERQSLEREIVELQVSSYTVRNLDLLIHFHGER